MMKRLPQTQEGKVLISDLRKGLESSNTYLTDESLQNLFESIHKAHDGALTFEEWRSGTCDCTHTAYKFDNLDRNFFIFSPDLLTNLHESVNFYRRVLKSGWDGDIHVEHDRFKRIGNKALDHPMIDVKQRMAVAVSDLRDPCQSH